MRRVNKIRSVDGARWSTVAAGTPSVVACLERRGRTVSLLCIYLLYGFPPLWGGGVTDSRGPGRLSGEIRHSKHYPTCLIDTPRGAAPVGSQESFATPNITRICPTTPPTPTPTPSQRPSDLATQRPSVPVAQRSSVPVAQRPRDPETQRLPVAVARRSAVAAACTTKYAIRSSQLPTSGLLRHCQTHRMRMMRTMQAMRNAAVAVLMTRLCPYPHMLPHPQTLRLHRLTVMMTRRGRRLHQRRGARMGMVGQAWEMDGGWWRSCWAFASLRGRRQVMCFARAPSCTE